MPSNDSLLPLRVTRATEVVSWPKIAPALTSLATRMSQPFVVSLVFARVSNVWCEPAVSAAKPTVTVESFSADMRVTAARRMSGLATR